MGRGRKSFGSAITGNWGKAFFNSIGLYITLINKGLSKSFKSEPLSNHIKIAGGFAFKNVQYKKSGIPIIRISDFNNEKVILDNVVYYEESDTLEKYELNESDIIIALTGGTIGKLGIVQAGLGKLYLNQRVGKFEVLHPDEFEKEYIYWIARGVEGIVKNLAWGAAIPNISPKQIEQLIFPIPTKDIQKDIISFLNDLKNDLIKDIEYFDFEIEKELISIQIKQVKALELKNELIFQLTQLENLNQAILQEAVQGKLVKQSPKEEPASELLKRIKEEKLKSGKKEKPLPPIKAAEIPFEIPESWVWCRLGEIAYITSGSTPSKDAFVESGIPYLKMYNLRNQEIDFHYKPQYIKEEVHNGQLKRCRAYPGDILMNIVGPPLGKIAIIPDSLPECNFNQAAVLIRPYAKEMNYYINYFLNEKSEINAINTKGVAGQDNISVTQAQSIRISLPPLSEQIRLVTEIEKQLAKTKQLKEHIIANQHATEQLLKALLHGAFEVEEKEKV